MLDFMEIYAEFIDTLFAIIERNITGNKVINVNNFAVVHREKYYRK